jgi:hypothetical protein
MTVIPDPIKMSLNVKKFTDLITTVFSDKTIMSWFFANKSSYKSILEAQFGFLQTLLHQDFVKELMFRSAVKMSAE